MAGEKREQTEERFRKFAGMTLDEVAIVAATNPHSVHAQAAQTEIRIRVAKAQIGAAEAQQKAANAQRVTAWGTIGLICATLIVALITYFAIK